MSRDQFSAWVSRHLIQIILAVATASIAWGAATAELKQKENIADHQADVRQLKEEQNAAYSLLLDMRCEQKPNDRRCKP